jgi:uncharacterized protein (TIGR03435 family)
MPVYALTVAKPGKMKLSSAEETIPTPASFPQMPGMPPMQVRRGQFISVSGARPGTLPEVQMAGHAVSTSDLARSIRQYAERRVVDKTGLDGLFDVELKFVGEVPVPPMPGISSPAPTQTQQPVPPLPLSSLRSAIEELGLKLEPTRLPVEFLVIQSVERPSEN